MRRHRNAMLSAHNKDDLDWFGRALAERGWNLYASERTALFLSERNIPVTDVGTFVGKPLLGHRIMTVSRRMAASLLATPDDTPEMFENDLPQFDLAYANLYPIEQVILEPDADFARVRRNIDYGGRLLLSMASYGDRIVLCRPEQFQEALDFIDQSATWSHEKRRVSILRFAAEAEIAVMEHSRNAAKCYRAAAEALEL